MDNDTIRKELDKIQRGERKPLHWPPECKFYPDALSNADISFKNLSVTSRYIIGHFTSHSLSKKRKIKEILEDALILYLEQNQDEIG